MKFHCERCKTKYSISDERVRGKILKIRCKNCSSVITVREPKAAAPAIPAAAKAAKPAAAAAPKPAQASTPAAQAPSAGQAALAGAFKQAVNNPESSAANMKASTSPVSLEAEWYLSKDGKQEGPFSMDEAHAWVSSKSPEDELYCWSEGFDDWLPTEKISHFRGIRVGSFSDLDSPDERTMIDGAFPFANPVETPKPLFAATMEAVATQEDVAVDDQVRFPASAPALTKPAAVAPPIPGKQAQAPMFTPAKANPAPAKANPVAAAPGPAAATGKPSSDLAIGEASRVVDLAALMANRGNAPSISPSGGALPGTTRALGNGTGMAPALAGVSSISATGPQLAPLGGLGSKPKKRSSLILTLVAASIVIALGAGLLVYMMSGDDQEDLIARGSVGGSGNLGYSFNDNRATPNAKGTTTTPDVPVVEDQPQTKTTRKGRPTGGPRGTSRVTKSGNGSKEPSGEVDLTTRTTTDPTGPLDPEEFMVKVRKSDFLMKMCYRQATKNNPLLKVPKSIVSVRIGTNGRVSSVKISNIATTPLGVCLAKRIKSWKFRKTTEAFSGQFPLVFGR